MVKYDNIFRVSNLHPQLPDPHSPPRRLNPPLYLSPHDYLRYLNRRPHRPLQVRPGATACRHARYLISKHPILLKKSILFLDMSMGACLSGSHLYRPIIAPGVNALICKLSSPIWAPNHVFYAPPLFSSLFLVASCRRSEFQTPTTALRQGQLRGAVSSQNRQLSPGKTLRGVFLCRRSPPSFLLSLQAPHAVLLLI